MFSKRFLLACLLFALAACRPAAVIPTLPAQVIWQAQLTPSLRWLGPLLNQCTREHPTVGLLVSESTIREMNTAQADFSLRWGEPSAGAGAAFILGPIEWVLVANKSNPVTEIAKVDLARLFSGEVSSWSDLKDCKGCAALKTRAIPYIYAAGDDARTGFDLLFPAQPARPPTAILAPDAQAVADAVRQEPGALGFIPVSLVDSNLKRLNVTGSGNAMRVPLTVIIHGEASAEQNAWLVCLQTRLKSP
jgi:DNA-binding transcriptional LysR family regulator